MHDLPISVNDRMISHHFARVTFSRKFAYAKIKPLQKFPNLQYLTGIFMSLKGLPLKEKEHILTFKSSPMRIYDHIKGH